LTTVNAGIELCKNTEMTNDEFREFSTEWAGAWNAHDLDRILIHFSEDVTFVPPMATLLMPESGGVIQGKRMLEEYWREGLRRIPDLHFDVIATYVGVDTLVINYRNQKGGLVNEVLELDGHLVVRGNATYLDDPSHSGDASSDPA
jgi:ketosteroid isomerase-like protein